MALDTNFNVNPYYDDFDEDKKFLRVLFKPGYAVQARELTQLQTIIQKQVDRFGNANFKNGSAVSGGQKVIQDATYIKLDNAYLGTDVVANNFVGMTILSNDESKRGEVVKVYAADAGTSDPITLMVKQMYGDAFVAGEVIKTNENSPVYATISAGGVGTGQIFSINEGVFFYEGFFIMNSAQTVALSKYSNNSANVKIGFEITETIAKSTSDTTLLDPAQDASNYQAPGADRFVIDLVLATRAIDSTDTTKFIELSRVEAGQLTQDTKYPIFAVLEDTLARRTYDESGNYTVRPFKISLEDNSSNTAQTNVILSPGKAYVFGYEFETITPTRLIVDKPRDTTHINNKIVSADYGNFVYTTDHFGTWPINSLSTVDLHCVPNASINVTSTASISNTKIGTARIKSIAYEASSNTSNAKTYTYRTYLTDVNVNNSITGLIRSANLGNVTIANSTAGQVFSSITDAYKGAKLRIKTGPGSTEAPKMITAFDATNQLLTLATNFVTVPTTASTFSIDFEFNDCDSIANFSSTTRNAAASIDTRSKDNASTYKDAFISDTKLEPSIFKLGDEYVANNSIADYSYTYRRLHESITFTANVSTALAFGTDESMLSASGSSAIQEKYIVVCTTAGGSYAVGDVIPADKITVDTGTRKLTVSNSAAMSANIISTVYFSGSSGVGQKTKSRVSANATVQVTGGTDVFSNSTVLLYGTEGQTYIANTYVVKTPDTAQSLFCSDVISLVEVLDFHGLAVTVANQASATVVTDRYTLINGQKDSFYDHAYIKLKAGSAAPTGHIVVRYNRYTSSGAGFFTNRSYPDYNDIYEYTSTSGNVFKLRDCIDYRAVRNDASAGSGSAVTFDVASTGSGPKLPQNGSNIQLDYDYYLPRVDKVVLNKNKTFEVVKGISSLSPFEPKDKNDAMTMYVLVNEAYVAKSNTNIDVNFIENKRFTMRDIGSLEKRIQNLEYYTSLSALEQSAINKQDFTILDSSNLPRFKNGILVDSFTGHSVADVTAVDYQAAIDVSVKELRPVINISSYNFTFDAANSSGVVQSGRFITANTSNTTFIDQAIASKSINVNPFNVVNFVGKITLDPSSDIWNQSDGPPKEVTVNLGGEKDAWDLILKNTGLTAGNIEYSNWNTSWSGQTFVSSDQRVYESSFAYGIPRPIYDVKSYSEKGSLTFTTTTTKVVPKTITQNIGDRVVDVSVIPYMRAINILVVGSNFKPDTIVYPFFDNELVANRVVRANKFTFSSNTLNYQTTVGNPERLTIKNGAGTTIGNATVVKTSGNAAFVVSTSGATGAFTSGSVLGQTTGASYTITGYEHYTGSAVAASASTITLALNATSANNIANYNASVIYIANGTGAGQQATISSYNPSTRVATISGTWTTTPDTTSTYSIGNLTSSRGGDVAGIFFAPGNVFRAGEKHFRLIDNSSGDVGSSATNGDASFFSQGLLEKKETTIVSTVAPSIERSSVNSSVPVTRGAGTTQTIVGYYDPLAQTFLVSPTNFPQGIFLEKARFCFASKDEEIPITLQVRTTVNGYPSSSVVYPYGTVTLTPDKVNTTVSPSLDDAAKYTEFRFDTPIFLQPGEHSFVLLANSNKYQMYVAEIGKLDLVGGKQISEQPYGGTLFLSQNGSTWTADQTTDMMFRLYRNTFSTSTAIAQFKLDSTGISSNVAYDVLHPITSEVSVANTSVVYTLSTEKSTGGMTSYKQIIPQEDYDMDDGDGRRVLNPTTGNNSLILRATMATTNPDITPFLDTSRFGGIFVENRINNMPLRTKDFVISNGGSSYANSADVTVSFSGGAGSGASATATVTSNVITAITVTGGGSGYTTSPTVTITPGSGGGTGAVVTYNGEDSKTGGNSETRYITRKVTLADGFDSGDLRVYLTAYKSGDSDILVYYKLLSKSDTDEFDNKGYQLMTQISNGNFISANKGDYRELVYAPGTGGSANNSVSYTNGSSTFTAFKTFAIKIVMTGTNTVDVPKIRDLRVIALPAG
jgi:hypothetical protein